MKQFTMQKPQSEKRLLNFWRPLKNYKTHKREPEAAENLSQFSTYFVYERVHVCVFRLEIQDQKPSEFIDGMLQHLIYPV